MLSYLIVILRKESAIDFLISTFVPPDGLPCFAFVRVGVCGCVLFCFRFLFVLLFFFVCFLLVLKMS